jgi:phosphoribosylanthranilate isomerase
MKLKVCGMKYQDNINQVAELQPDYLGFIFYDGSSRFFDSIMPQLSKKISKVGVFVNASIQNIIEIIEKYDLQAVQLHGEESPAFCEELKKQLNIDRSKNTIEIIKVFSIKDEFNFNILRPYEEVCDYFLFDTKGKLPGGNGYTFDWKVLKDYPSVKPFFLSGGLGIDEIDNIKLFLKSPESKYCYALDINSRFEKEPGLKDIALLKEFKDQIF